jgi:hypothetical protein
MPSAVNQGNCPCGGGTLECVQTITVKLCGQVLEGATVAIWADDTKAVLYGTGVTDASGEVDVHISVPAEDGTHFWYVEASHGSARVGVGNDVGFCAVEEGTATAGPPFEIVVPPAANYHCNQFCQFPLAETLHYSDDVLGPVTLTYGGSDWRGATTHSFPSSDPPPPPVGCAAVADVDVTVIADGFVGGVAAQFPRVHLSGGIPTCTDCVLKVADGGSLRTCSASSYTVDGCPDEDAFAVSFTYSAGVLNPEAPATVSGTLTE